MTSIKKEILDYVTAQYNLEDVVLCEMSQSDGDSTDMIPLI